MNGLDCMEGMDWFELDWAKIDAWIGLNLVGLDELGFLGLGELGE